TALRPRHKRDARLPGPRRGAARRYRASRRRLLHAHEQTLAPPLDHDGAAQADGCATQAVAGSALSLNLLLSALASPRARVGTAAVPRADRSAGSHCDTSQQIFWI